MTAVIEASSAGVRDMSDGSLRITFEFEPRHAAEAFALFGPRGRAVAIAALKDGAAKVAEPEKPKGGEWAKLAGIWCADPDFHAFLNQTYPEDDHVENSDDAAMTVRVYCGIQSRAELDENPAALHLFKTHFRLPFMRWMQERGISK